MSPAGLVAHQVRYEQKAFWRNPPAAAFTFAFPVMFLVVFASLNRNDNVDFLGGLKFNQYYVPAIAAFAVITACYTNIAMTLAIRRDAGVLKRLHGTPLPTWVYLAGLIGGALVISALLVLVTTLVGVVVYGIEAPRHVLALAVTLALGAATFCALGTAVGSLVPNADAAPAVVNFLLFPVVFLSGTFFPLKEDSTVAHMASFLPVRPFILAVFETFDPRVRGLGFAGRDLLVLALWFAGAALVATRTFSWQPRR